MRGARFATAARFLQYMGFLVTPDNVKRKLALSGVRLCMMGPGDCLAMIIRTLWGSLSGLGCLVSSGKN